MEMKVMPGLYRYPLCVGRHHMPRKPGLCKVGQGQVDDYVGAGTAPLGRAYSWGYDSFVLLVSSDDTRSGLFEFFCIGSGSQTVS